MLQYLGSTATENSLSAKGTLNPESSELINMGDFVVLDFRK